MAKLVNLEILSLPKVRIIGREVACSMEAGADNPVPALWQACFGDGTIASLKALPLAVPDCTIGWMGDVEGKDFRYIAGVIAQEGAPVPEGMAYRDLPACQVGKGHIFGNLQNGEIYIHAYELTLAGMAEKQVEPDDSLGWSAEIYPDDVDFSAEEGVLCYFQPCKRANF